MSCEAFWVRGWLDASTSLTHLAPWAAGPGGSTGRTRLTPCRSPWPRAWPWACARRSPSRRCRRVCTCGVGVCCGEGVSGFEGEAGRNRQRQGGGRVVGRDGWLLRALNRAPPRTRAGTRPASPCPAHLSGQRCVCEARAHRLHPLPPPTNQSSCHGVCKARAHRLHPLPPPIPPRTEVRVAAVAARHDVVGSRRLLLGVEAAEVLLLQGEGGREGQGESTARAHGLTSPPVVPCR